MVLETQSRLGMRKVDGMEVEISFFSDVLLHQGWHDFVAEVMEVMVS
jgi:hypothetical protein